MRRRHFQKDDPVPRASTTSPPRRRDRPQSSSSLLDLSLIDSCLTSAGLLVVTMHSFRFVVPVCPRKPSSPCIQSQGLLDLKSSKNGRFVSALGTGTTVNNVIDILHHRSASAGSAASGIRRTVGMCDKRIDGGQDVAFRINQRAIASVPTATVRGGVNSSPAVRDRVDLDHLY